MKTTIIFNFCVALLLTIVPNGVRGAETNEEVLNKMARKGIIIDGIFKPSVNGSLGAGSYGTIYKGQFVPLDNREVAMKFSPATRRGRAQNEYKIYKYLNAVNNSNVENNGIPSIYYFGRTLNHYTMLAMSSLDPTFQQTVKNGEIREVDVFIVFREFVRIIKYIHSCGVIHMGINIENIIIQNGRGFVFDFGSSYDMSEYSRAQNIDNAKYDFQRFLWTMFLLVQPRKNWDWLDLSSDDHCSSRMICIDNFIHKLWIDAKSNEANQFKGLRRIFVECAKHTFDKTSTGIEAPNGDWIPFYDQLYQVVYEECNIYGDEAATSMSSISSIPDPFAMDMEWTRPTEINYTLFEDMYAEQIQNARKKKERSGCFCLKYQK